MIAIVDYGLENLSSLKSAFESMGRKIVVTNDERTILNSEKIIIPGDGVFSEAMEKLRAQKLDEIIKKAARQKRLIFGIGLGMQLLFDTSSEDGHHEGLGLISGIIIPIARLISPDFKIPNMGWRGLQFPVDKPIHPLFRYVAEGDAVYFLHSYTAVECKKSIIATVNYGAPIAAGVAHDNIYGCQFHPEDSGVVGFSVLQGFCEIGE